MSECKQCGKCCGNNGLIPPLNIDEAACLWLHVLVANLREHFGCVSEDWPCVFLTSDNKCAIHDGKPRICREFMCEVSDEQYE